LKRRPKEIKLLICVPYTHPFYAGGGMSALRFAKCLLEKKINVRLLALNQNFSLPWESKIGNVPVFRIPYIKYNIFTKILSLPFIVGYYLYFILTNNVIMIFGNNNILYELIIVFGWIFNKKVIFRSTMYKDDDISTLINKNKLIRRLRIKIFGKVNGYFSLSPKFTESYLNIYGLKERILESSQGVDFRQFKPASVNEKENLIREFNLPENTIIIISVAYLIKRKGFEQIFKVLNRINLPFLYIIVGNYEVDKEHYLSSRKAEMEYLYNKGKKLLGNKILFAGTTDNVQKYLQVSDIFLINSKKEGLPNALLEAMACGVCPVSYHMEGLVNYILYDKENSIIFNSEEEMEYSIRGLITDKTLRDTLGQNANKFIQENCSIERMADKFIVRFLT
jgi:glycosyltransferase involved in cell wall biosynthesis